MNNIKRLKYIIKNKILKFEIFKVKIYIYLFINLKISF